MGDGVGDIVVGGIEVWFDVGEGVEVLDGSVGDGCIVGVEGFGCVVWFLVEVFIWEFFLGFFGVFCFCGMILRGKEFINLDDIDF